MKIRKLMSPTLDQYQNMTNVGLCNAGDSKGPAITEERSKVAPIWLRLYLNDLTL